MPLDTSAIESALALGPQQLTGTFRLDLRTGAWWWSDETYRIHGFAPGEVVPTTELVLAHKHPADRERVRRVLATGIRTGAPFASVHQIMDAHGCTRVLTIVGSGRRDDATGELVGLEGYFVDVTSAVSERADQRATAQIAASAATRGVIEQAKGAVAAVYGTDPESAFTVVRGASNDRNVPLREIAERLVEAATAHGPASRAAFDRLLGLGAR